MGWFFAYGHTTLNTPTVCEKVDWSLLKGVAEEDFVCLTVCFFFDVSFCGDFSFVFLLFLFAVCPPAVLHCLGEHKSFFSLSFVNFKS